MRRTVRVHLPAADAQHLIVLACLIEDRAEDEQAALVRTAVKIDRLDGTPEGTVGRWEREALATLQEVS